jgi:hypothetical protein
MIVEEDRRQIPAHVPLDVVGQHAEEDVRTDPRLRAMNRAMHFVLLAAILEP